MEQRLCHRDGWCHATSCHWSLTIGVVPPKWAVLSCQYSVCTRSTEYTVPSLRHCNQLDLYITGGYHQSQWSAAPWHHRLVSRTRGSVARTVFDVWIVGRCHSEEINCVKTGWGSWENSQMMWESLTACSLTLRQITRVVITPPIASTAVTVCPVFLRC